MLATIWTLKYTASTKCSNENKDKLPRRSGSKLEDALASAQEAKDSDDPDAMKAASDELMRVANEVNQMAQAAQAGQAQQGSAQKLRWCKPR